MKKIFLLLTVLGMVGFTGCTGPQGPPGYPGPPGQDGTNGVESEVFDLKNINFDLIDGKYSIYQTLTPNILDSDNILIYRMSDLINPTTPIWQLIPRTLFLAQGELDYDYDFSKQDFQIYAGGTYIITPNSPYVTNQTFRIVIIPGYFSSRRQSVDLNDYNAVIKAYGLDDTHVTVLNSK